MDPDRRRLPPAVPAGSGAQYAASMRYKGVNLAGADFGEDSCRAPRTKITSYPTAEEVDYFTGKGMTIFRLPFRWERLQRRQLAVFNAAEQARMDTFVSYATGKGAYVLLDPHNYARYFGNLIGETRRTGQRIRGFLDQVGRALPQQQPGDLWPDERAARHDHRIVGQRRQRGHPGYPPHRGHQPDPGAGQRLGAARHSWGDNWYGTPNAVAMLNITDPGNNYAFEVHQYLDSDGSGSQRYLCERHDRLQRMANFTTGCGRTTSAPFWASSAAVPTLTCLSALDDLLTHLDQNSDVYLGWTYWAAGPWWGDYFMSIEPLEGADRPQMTPLSQHLP